ncbi:uncharacterized protein LOC124695431 [Lolium rigidum]|uniref:uncharacterized protein LOC124695431 n=1 Tax=Lolium rigidum TaxID=89674 RepID=UPI001F5C75D1|nr:uncharacterized protein LOC124695431 [Lolium rigidum]
MRSLADWLLQQRLIRGYSMMQGFLEEPHRRVGAQPHRVTRAAKFSRIYTYPCPFLHVWLYDASRTTRHFTSVTVSSCTDIASSRKRDPMKMKGTQHTRQLTDCSRPA